MIPTFERRFIDASELRAESVDGAPRIVGYSALFNVLSEDLGGFREQVAPGTFAHTIKNDDVRALWNHDANFVLGRNVMSKTLSLAEDSKGLAMEVAPPDTTWARDLQISIARRDVTQQSFGFRTISDKWETRNGQNFRTLLQVKLFDVSPVTYPAYPQTEVQSRSLMLEVAGVDPEVAMAALVRAERKLPALEGDFEVLTRAGEKVLALSARRTWDPSTQEAIAMMRRRLELSAAS